MKTLKLVVLAAVAVVSGITVLGIAAATRVTPKIQMVAKLPGAPVGPLTIVYFRADPPRVQPGQSSILRWKVTGATSVTLYGEDNSLCERQFGTVAAEDSLMVCPQETTIYTLTAQGPDGETMQSATVQVNGVAPRIPTGAR